MPGGFRVLTESINGFQKVPGCLRGASVDATMSVSGGLKGYQEGRGIPGGSLQDSGVFQRISRSSRVFEGGTMGSQRHFRGPRGFRKLPEVLITVSGSIKEYL